MVYGWIDRNGNFYECKCGGHTEKCEEIKVFIGINPEVSGWIKITEGFIIYTVSNIHFKPTEYQMGTLYTLCMNNNYMKIYNDFINGFYKYLV